MKFNVKYFQEGGPMGAPAPGPEAGAPPPEGGAPAPGGAEGGQDPLMQIAQILSQGLQAQDCQALAQGAQMFLELVAQAQGGGQGGPPPEEPTVMKKGGKFVLKKKGDNPFAKKGKEEDKASVDKKGGKMAKKC
jgi:hypothetical protein